MTPVITDEDRRRCVVTGDYQDAYNAGASTIKPVNIREHLTGVVVPEGYKLETIDRVDEERLLLAAPDRMDGLVRLHTVESFIEYTKRMSRPDTTTVWADVRDKTLTAIFDDHVDDLAQWGEFRSVVELTHTPEWVEWTSKSGQMLSQEGFAEHIERNLREIKSPAAGEMLEIAQTFHATMGANFRQAKRLQDGRTQVLYDEELEAKAGEAGTLEIPNEFTLAVAPFVGEPAYALTARLRYRANGGKLTMGYTLDRPHLVIEDVFNAQIEEGQEGRKGILQRLEEAFPGVVFRGEPRPSGR